MRTRQEMFTIAAAHLVKQNRRATCAGDNEIGCMYRAPDGAQCAIGCLIPDDKYNPDFEGNVICGTGELGSMWAGRILEAAGIAYSDRYFAQDLQAIHDREQPHEWPLKLMSFAVLHKLTMPPELQVCVNER